ncbi:MAG: HD domain-containing protein [Clostridia bacterium]|nr:HD domain-containing protein [Clostridia bacterium]
MDYIEAKKYAEKKHKGNPKRIGGADYITHPVAVSEILREKGFGLDVQIMGLFHDLLEDTDATPEEIIELGNPEVLDVVRLVTKEPGYDISDYYSRILFNEKASAVKLADRIHNLRSCLDASEEWRHEYYMETVEEFADLAVRFFNVGGKRGQVFEQDILDALDRVFDSFSLEFYCS